MHIIHYTKNKVIVSVINILRFLFATQVGLIQENDELLIKLYGSLSYYYYYYVFKTPVDLFYFLLKKIDTQTLTIFHNDALVLIFQHTHFRF